MSGHAGVVSIHQYVQCDCIEYTMHSTYRMIPRDCSATTKRFFNTCVKLAGDDRDIDLYHWSSERFSSAWVNAISVLLAKGRARVSVADAATDWPKRIRDMQYLDHESIVAGA